MSAKRRLWMPRIGVLLVAICGVYRLPILAHAAPPKPEDVAAVLKAQHEGLKSLLVEYDVETTPLISKDVLWEYQRVYSYDSVKCVLATDGVRVHLRTSGSSKAFRKVVDRLMQDDPKRFEGVTGDLSRVVKFTDIERILPAVAAEAFERVLVFDGTALWEKSPYTLVGIDRKENPAFLVKDVVPGGGAVFVTTYLDFAGHGVPDPGVSDRVATSENRLWDLLVAEGVSVAELTESVNGAACIVVTVGERQRIWLDPAIGFASRRRESYRAGRLAWKIECRDQVKVPNAAPELWLPMQIVEEVVNDVDLPAEFTSHLTTRRTYRARRLEANQPKNETLLRMNPDAGAYVTDTRLRRDGADDEALPKGVLPGVSYVQPADESDLARVIKEAQRSDPRPKGQSRVGLLILMNVIILLGFVGWLFFRRIPRKKR